ESAGVPRRPRGNAGVVLSRPTLKRLYITERLSIAEVARRFDVGPGTVIRNLEAHGLPHRDPRQPLDRATLRHLHVDEQRGTRAVAARLGVSADKVRTELARAQIRVRPPGRPPTLTDPAGEPRGSVVAKR